MSLTDIKIRQAKAIDKTLKLADANGLYLEVKPGGAKLWRYRYRIAGKENLYAIGDYPTITLSEARKVRDEARELIKKGLHPAHARQNERLLKIAANNDTFKAIAEEWNKTPEGKGVTFKTSYGASGDQSRAVESGPEA